MSQYDYYFGPYADVTANGIPASSCDQDDVRRDHFNDTDPGDQCLLCFPTGTDVSGTFVADWAGPKTVAGAGLILNDSDNGYVEA